MDLTSPDIFVLLGFSLVVGLKHATEVDHVVAVSSIVSDERSLLRSSLVGALWGVGHTASLLAVGIIALALRIAIPLRVTKWLEFGVALMIIGLGASALIRSLRRRAHLHIHQHQHDGLAHVHLHFHEHETGHRGAATQAHTHAILRLGFKPLLVGAMHGLAGSAALTVLLLTQIDSAARGLLYLIVFGLGSIIGMLLMSALIGLPFALGARRVSGAQRGLQTVAGAVGLIFGLWYAYQTGIAGGLLYLP